MHRLKINIILYFKTNDNSYGYFQAPSELIDVPVSAYDDFKKNIDFSKTIEKYNNSINNINLYFYAYTIYGVIDDIFKAILIERKYPWDDKKFEKKIYRISYFFMIYFNNIYKNINEIKQKINTFFNNYDNIEAQKITFIKYNDEKVSSDSLFNKLTDGFAIIKKRVNDDPTEYNMKNLQICKEVFYENFQLFEPESIKNIFDEETGSENVPYLKKYLKYKNKYLQLKNKNKK